MAFITFQTFDNAIEAHLLKNKLESEGVNCYLFDENTVSIYPLYSNTIGGIKLKIDKDDLLKARGICNQTEQVPLIQDNGVPIVCPRCGSGELYTDFKSMKGILGITSIFISFFLMVLPIHYKTVYKCKSCGKEFE